MTCSRRIQDMRRRYPSTTAWLAAILVLQLINFVYNVANH
jgi:hypothetical protein